MTRTIRFPQVAALTACLTLGILSAPLAAQTGTQQPAPVAKHHSKVKGAVVGAAAGHMMGHHAKAGAAAGALVQHHRNKQAAKAPATVGH